MVPPGTVDPDAALRAGAAMLGSATAGTPFVISVDDQTSWAWISSTRTPSHYRVRKAEEILGHSLAENRLEIEVALLACAQLGLLTPDGTLSLRHGMSC